MGGARKSFLRSVLFDWMKSAKEKERIFDFDGSYLVVGKGMESS